MEEPTPSPGPPSVYFARGGPCIKIGWSTDPSKRVARLATATPERLELLTTTPGTEATERALHAAFRHAHVRREWFRASPWLLAFVDWVKRGSGVVHAAELLAHAETSIEQAEAARRAAEARAAAAERALAAAEAETKRCRAGAWEIATDVLVLLREHEKEINRAVDQTDDHEGLSEVVRTAARQLRHATCETVGIQDPELA